MRQTSVSSGSVIFCLFLLTITACAKADKETGGESPAAVKQHPADPWPTQGEIDLVEARGQEPTTYQTNDFYGHAANKNLVSNSEGYINTNADLTAYYHVYEMTWEKTRGGLTSMENWWKPNREVMFPACSAKPNALR